jgi:hypothetical protein
MNIYFLVLCKFDFYLTLCSLLKVLNQNLNLQFYQMDFRFKFLDIHMNEKFFFVKITMALNGKT